MHTPTEVTEQALRAARALRADCFLSVGGGSTIGLGKALSIRTGFPHICIPSTYAGSEMTAILGETVDGVKITRRDPKILPATVIYDINLTMSLPKNQSATSGMNAIAHAIEALYAPDSNPMIRILAIKGIRTLLKALIAIHENDQNLNARYDALYGSWLCGICLENTTMALHHKLCHTVGGAFNLPHSELHTILLPHAFAYNAAVASQAARDLAESLPYGDDDAVTGLNKLVSALGVRTALADLGLRKEDVDKAATMAMDRPYANPRAMEMATVRELLRRAWAGEMARMDM